MLERNADSPNPIAIALRMLEIFTDMEVYHRHAQLPGIGSVVQNILEFLVQNGRSQFSYNEIFIKSQCIFFILM